MRSTWILGVVVAVSAGCPTPTEQKPDCTLIDVWADEDGDGFGGAALEPACALAEGQAGIGQDCDDGDADTHPDAEEICDGLDNDCNGEIDQGLPDLTLYYTDADNDGYGVTYPAIEACDDPGDGWADNDLDCDDTSAAVNPAATEVCNGGTDDDCDGFEDDADPSLDLSSQATWYADADGDTYGNQAVTIQACRQPSGYVDNPDDCVDVRADINPDAVEVCNGVDDDCDNLVDDNDPDVDPGSQLSFFQDADLDGWGTPGMSVLACQAGPGLASNDLDCNDAVPQLNQDDDDNDGWTSCDGDCNDNDSTVNPDDIDNDGFTACDATPDCAPADPTVFPGANEITADAVDQDCDGVDDCYRDADFDTYGSTTVITGSTMSCLGPGEANNPDDCDDGNAGVTIPREWYDDLDGDGFGAGVQVSFACTPPFPDLSPFGNDCDDTNDTIFPGATENCFDLIDQDCNGSLTCCDPMVEVEEGGTCYYLDGSGGSCESGYELAPQSILNTIADDFIGKDYKNAISSNCCIWHRDQAVELQDWGFNAGCNAAGPFSAAPALGGAGCTNALNMNSGQLTICMSQ